MLPSRRVHAVRKQGGHLWSVFPLPGEVLPQDCVSHSSLLPGGRCGWRGKRASTAVGLFVWPEYGLSISGQCCRMGAAACTVLRGGNACLVEVTNVWNHEDVLVIINKTFFSHRFDPLLDTHTQGRGWILQSFSSLPARLKKKRQKAKQKKGLCFD